MFYLFLIYVCVCYVVDLENIRSAILEVCPPSQPQTSWVVLMTGGGGGVGRAFFLKSWSHMACKVPLQKPPISKMFATKNKIIHTKHRLLESLVCLYMNFELLQYVVSLTYTQISEIGKIKNFLYICMLINRFYYC